MIPTQADIVEIGAAAAERAEDGYVRPPHKLLVTPETATAMLSIGRTKVYELMGAGQLPSVRITSARRIPVAALETFVQRLLDEPERGGRCG